MKLRKTAMRIISALLALLPLGGCAKDPYMLDGPGMENDLTWSDFTLIGDGSFTEYAFTITVMRDEKGDGISTISGEYQAADGTVYTLKSVRVETEDFSYLRGLRIGDFDEAEDETQKNPHVQMSIHYLDGTPEVKEISEELAAEICERFLPYFYSNNE